MPLPRRGALIVALVLSVARAEPGDAQSVSGWLLDEATAVAIEGATVSLLDRDEDQVVAEAITATDGAFQLSAPVPGHYKLRAHCIGYAMVTSAPLDLVESRSLVVEVRLSVVAVALPPVTVVSREPVDARLERWGYYERKGIYGKMGFAHLLEGEQLTTGAFTVSDLLREVRGMRVSAAGGRKVAVTCRSGIRPTIYLDGARFRAGLDDLSFPVSSIVAIEVYPGRVVPLQYSSSGRGCVVAVWTGIRPEQ